MQNMEPAVDGFNQRLLCGVFFTGQARSCPVKKYGGLLGIERPMESFTSHDKAEAVAFLVQANLDCLGYNT